MKSVLTSQDSMLDTHHAIQLENQALHGDSTDVAAAFRAITSIVME